MTIPKPPDSEYGSWEQYTGEDGQKYWQFRDTYGRVWDISPNWRVHEVYPDDPENGIYNEMIYQDVRGNFFTDWDDENGHHSEYWDPEKEWFYPYGPGTDYPDVEPMDHTSNAQEKPSPYDGFEDKNYAEDHLPPPYPYGQENYAQDHLPSPDTGIRGVEHFGAGRLPGPLQEPAPPAPDPEREAEERARAEEELNPDLLPPPADQIPPAEQPVPPTDPNADREPPEETPGPSFEDLGIEEHHAKGTSKIPDLVEEPAPAPPGPMLAGDLAGTGVAYPGLVEGGDEGLLPPAAQTPEAEPPVQPTPPPGDAGDGGIPGLGVPYQDFIPLYPMVQDPATGEWRNAQPEEIPKPDQQPEGNDLTQLNPNLLDPIAPGPTLDTGLVERIEQSPGLVDKVNQDPAVAEALERDPTQIDQIEQYLGVAEQRTTEPSGGTDLGGAADPSLTDAGSTAGQDGHDHDDGVFEGI